MNDAACCLHLFLGMKHVRGILLHGPPGIVYSLLSLALPPPPLHPPPLPPPPLLPPPSPPLPPLLLCLLLFLLPYLTSQSPICFLFTLQVLEKLSWQDRLEKCFRQGNPRLSMGQVYMQHPHS